MIFNYDTLYDFSLATPLLLLALAVGLLVNHYYVIILNVDVISRFSLWCVARASQYALPYAVYQHFVHVQARALIYIVIQFLDIVHAHNGSSKVISNSCKDCFIRYVIFSS